jgi:NAD-dependent deacetylase
MTATETHPQNCTAEGCEFLYDALCRKCGGMVCRNHAYQSGGVDDQFCPTCAPEIQAADKEKELERITQHALRSIPGDFWGRAKRAVTDGKVLVITGAGMSAESGIPTFRGSDGYWTVGSERYTPQQIATSVTMENQIDVLWDWYLHRLKNHVDAAEPNPGHYALADLDTYIFRRTAAQFLLVTQNIDRLHLEAGNIEETTIEIHGNGTMMRCSDECWLRNNKEVPKYTEIPKDAKFPEDLTCPDCGYMMRPHVLLFDESYSQELYRSEEAHQFAQEADLVISVGCSGGVPIAQILANYAVMRDSIVIDVNPEPGPLSTLAEQQGIWLRGKSGILLPKLVDFLTT